MSLRHTNIAVTGAGGFIGSALVPVLLAAGANIRALSGPPDVPLPPLPAPAIEMRGEITQADTLRRLCKGAEIVVHLAGPPAAGASFDQPRDYARIHVLGTIEVLQACRAMGVRRLIYLSSAEVYGHPRHNPVSEEHPLAARSPYGACKIAAEQFIHAHAMAYGLHVIILRPFSVYGPGLSPLSLIGTLFRQVRDAECLTLHDLRPIRDYCYLDDLVRAIARACTHTHSGVLALNIGSGQGLSVQDLATTLFQVLGRVLPIREYRAARRPGHSEILELVADIRRARTVLDWTPTIGLAEGLRRIALAHLLKVA
jgi:nucleoside-diphosphate-sugar epimerase